MKVKIYYSSQITFIALFLYMLLVMPIVDSISGFFHNSIPIGQIYRILIFICIFFLMAQYSREKLGFYFFFLSCLSVIQILIGSEYWLKSLQDIVKLFTPILMIVLFSDLIKKEKISQDELHKILNFWAIIYPLLIIIPGILGIGTSAYDNVTGWKGWFYAVNEISFILSCLIIYQIYKLDQNVRIYTAIILGLDILAIMLMGTKTGYATIVIFMCIYFLRIFLKTRKKDIIRNGILVILGFIAVILIFYKFKDVIRDIYERWSYQSSVTSTSILDFLTSHRLRRLQPGLSLFMSRGFLCFLFGWGFGGELVGMINMEMDWIDLLFRSGIIGFFIIAGFYFQFFYKNCTSNIWKMLIFLWTMALSFGAGHVLFYGQSGMMLAMILSFVKTIPAKGNRSYIPRKVVEPGE